MKKIMLIAAALAAILTLSFIAVGYENHVRWNGQLDECVYFYDKGSEKVGQCFVAEKNCDDRSGQDDFKTVDPVECYYEPRSKQKSAAPSDCAQFVEGDLIVLRYQGSDPDNDHLEYTFEAPFDNDAHSWQTARGDAGHYEVGVTVNDGQYDDKAVVCFDVLPGNHAPKLTVNDVTVDEGQPIELKPVCDDEDGDAVRLSFSGDMTSATWTPTYDDAGTYTVTVTCTDTEGASDSKSVTVVVNDVNRKPVLTGVEDVTVAETELVDLKPRCVDPEGSETTITYSGDMTTDKWKTTYADAGTYDVTVTCEDESGLSTSKDITVTVTDTNRPPSITAMVIAG